MAKVISLVSSVALFVVSSPGFAQAPTAATTSALTPPVAQAPGTAESTPLQSEAVPPAPAPVSPAPSPDSPAPVSPAPVSPAPAPYPAPSSSAPPPYPSAPAYPATSQPPPPPNYATSQPPPPPNYATNSGGNSPEPTPPPSNAEDDHRSIPEFSVRLDPLNWLLEGRLGLELEMAAYKFISVEMVPVFVVNNQPPVLNLGSIPDTLSQKSNGLGSLAGTSIGAGFWLGGKPFQGTVLRFYFTNYGYKYEAKDSVGVIDSVRHTERYLVGMLGSHSKWGPFTIAYGIGLGVEMNREKRCFDGKGSTRNEAGTLVSTSGCSDDEILIQVQRSPLTSTAVTGGFHPVYLLGRLSLGFVF